MAGKSHDATFYVQVEPVWSRWVESNGLKSVESLRAVSITKKKPDRPRGGTVLVKLTLRVPDAAFMPLRPEAVIVVPEDMTVTTPIEAIAEDPS